MGPRHLPKFCIKRPKATTKVTLTSLQKRMCSPSVWFQTFNCLPIISINLLVWRFVFYKNPFRERSAFCNSFQTIFTARWLKSKCYPYNCLIKTIFHVRIWGFSRIDPDGESVKHSATYQLLFTFGRRCHRFKNNPYFFFWQCMGGVYSEIMGLTYQSPPMYRKSLEISQENLHWCILSIVIFSEHMHGYSCQCQSSGVWELYDRWNCRCYLWCPLHTGHNQPRNSTVQR